jgi:ADP-ribosylglycohydrolase
MLGAIAGDVIGSVYEWECSKTKDFSLFVPKSTFTDDSVLTVAVADWLLTGQDLVDIFHSYTQMFPHRGYGLGFHQWATNRRRQPYNSFGNGSAMRVSPVAFAFRKLEEVLSHAEQSAAVTHNHPEGIRGAQAVATAIFLAREGKDKDDIRREVESRFLYDLGPSLQDIRAPYAFNETCQETVPQALLAFLESENYEDAVRNAISLGGDADTLACIAGGIAEAYYGGVPAEIVSEVRSRLDAPLLKVIDRFYEQFVS